MARMPNLFAPLLHSASTLAPELAQAGRTEDEQSVVLSLQREIDRFCEKNVDGLKIDKQGALGQDLLAAVAEQGWFGLTVPETYGGAGLSLSAATSLVTALSRHNGSLATCVGLHSGLGLHTFIHKGSDALRERYLPEVAEGTRIAAFAATEPGAGSDIGSMKSVLYQQDGKLRLRGSKCYVTNGGFARALTIVASSPGLGDARHGHTVVLVDPAWEGVNRQGEENKLGLKGSSTITIDFDDVEIPQDHILGTPSKGMEHAHEALTWGRTFMAAGCLGAAHAALKTAAEHTEQRVQFGRPLNQFPLVRVQLASSMAMIYAAESVIRLVCEVHDSQTRDIALDSTVAKIFVSENTWHAIDRSIQLMGGAGYMEETSVPRRLRDVRVTRIFEGANDVLRLHLAVSLLGWSREELVALGEHRFEGPAALSMVAQRVQTSLAQVGATLAVTQKKLGFRLMDAQEKQEHIADALIAAYAMLAVYLRTCGELQRDSGGTREIALAELSTQLLADQAQQALRRLEADTDGTTRSLADAILLG